MAFITCPQCGRRISDSAVQCPECGWRPSMARRPTGTGFWAWVGRHPVLSLLILIFGVIPFCSAFLTGGGDSSGSATATPARSSPATGAAPTIANPPTSTAIATNTPTLAQRSTSVVATIETLNTRIPTATPGPPTPTVAPPTPTPVPKIGDTIRAPNWELTVVEAQRVVGPLVWSQFGNKEEPVGEWFVLTVTLKNIGRENFAVNAWDFELRTAAGATYKHTSELGAYSYAEFRKMVPLGKQVPPGATVRTPLVFDIGKGTEGVFLVFGQAKDSPINVG